MMMMAIAHSINDPPRSRSLSRSRKSRRRNGGRTYLKENYYLSIPHTDFGLALASVSCLLLMPGPHLCIFNSITIMYTDKKG